MLSCYRDGAAIKQFLEDQARAAGAELMRFYGEDLSIDFKQDRSLVTEADLASEKAIVSALASFYPDDLIIAEESGLSDLRKQEGRYVWVIDPLDGTTNFANTYPFFCVSIGFGRLDKRGEVELLGGAIFDPVRDELYLGYKGEGATCNNVPMRVREPRPIDRTFLVTGFYYNRHDVLTQEVRRFSTVAQQCQAIRRDGAAALDLALTAKGVFDAFWERGLQPWDTCAGALLVAESGGILLDYLNVSGTFGLESPSILAGSASTVNDLMTIWGNL